MLGGMLRFRDNVKSYYDRGVFVIVGAALFTPSPQVGCGCPTRTQFLGFTFKTLRISNNFTIYTLRSWETSYLEHLHRELALFPRGTYKRPLDSVVSVLRRSVIMNI